MAYEENKMYHLNELNQSTKCTLLNLVSVLGKKSYEHNIQEYLNHPNNTRTTQAINEQYRHIDIISRMAREESNMIIPCT